MKRIANLFLALALFVSLGVVMCSCKSDQMPIDNSIYFSDEATYKFLKESEATVKISDLTNSVNNISGQFTNLSLKGSKKWICGMNLSYAYITLVANEDCEINFTFRITKMQNVNELDLPNFDEDGHFFYNSTGAIKLQAGKPVTYTFEIFDKVSDSNAPTVIFDIDDTCYIASSTLKLSFSSIDFFGEH